MTDNIPVERHPFPPFIPRCAGVDHGNFPPKPLRWSMEFYYPNKTNDFWRIMGIIFYGDVNHFRLSDGTFDEASIRKFLTEKGIALHDTGLLSEDSKTTPPTNFLTSLSLSISEHCLPRCRNAVLSPPPAKKRQAWSRCSHRRLSLKSENGST